MMYVQLHNLRFRSFHGLYEEERMVGNEYEVNLDVGFEPASSPVHEISDTLDYTVLHKIVKERMAIPTPLLETIATEIAEKIRAGFPSVSKISISVKKLFPPVNNFEGAVGVSFEWNK